MAIKLLPGTFMPKGRLYSLSAQKTEAMNTDTKELFGCTQPSSSLPAPYFSLGARKMEHYNLA